MSEEVVRCRSCNAPIVFLMTAKKHRIPVEPDTVEDGDTLFDHTRHKSHFAECPQADKWRKKR